jgi:hypothetical protein
MMPLLPLNRLLLLLDRPRLLLNRPLLLLTSSRNPDLSGKFYKFKIIIII